MCQLKNTPGTLKILLENLKYSWKTQNASPSQGEQAVLLFQSFRPQVSRETNPEILPPNNLCKSQKYQKYVCIYTYTNTNHEILNK